MILTDRQKQQLDGICGEAASMAMAILVELGEAIGAEEMVEITHVHTDSGFYLGDAGLEFVEHLARIGGQVAVPTSLNNTSHDIERCRSYGVSEAVAARIRRLETAHLSLGVLPSWTCAPYQDGILPRQGDLVAWSESNAISFANSVLGARTNRTGDLVDICCAITGSAPKTGLYLDENRKADIHLILEDFSDDLLEHSGLYPLLGYWVGRECGNRVAAVSGIPKTVTMNDLKGFGAAAASSGATALYHMVGVTPEAPDLASCLKETGAVRTVRLTPDHLRQAEELLTTAEGRDLDWVGLGCPHLSRSECVEVARCMAGKTVHESTRFTLYTSRLTHRWLKAEGILPELSLSGIEVYTDGCLLLYPQGSQPPGTMMTNSAKAANYIFSQSGFKAAYGTIQECTESAVSGRIVRRNTPWKRN